MVKRAGLTPWPKLFHGMRASCETDLFEQHPLQTVARWMGHSPKIAVANYLRVREEDFDKAFDKATGKGQDTLAHFPAHSPHVAVNQGSSRNEQTPENPGFDELGSTVKNCQTDGLGFEPRVPVRVQ